MQIRLLSVTLSLVCVCILSACASTTVTSPTQTPQKNASILQALPNAEYPIEFTRTGKAQLKDGVFEESVARVLLPRPRFGLAKNKPSET